MTEKPRIQIKITELKKQYPRPVRAALWMTGDYCVGGAFCLAVHARLDSVDHMHFPSGYELFRAVLEARGIERDLLPDEDYDKMMNLADGVTKANDVGSFGIAWKLLGRLLNTKARQQMPPEES